MHRLILATGLLLGTTLAASAQSWVPWHQTPVHDMTSAGRQAVKQQGLDSSGAKRRVSSDQSSTSVWVPGGYLATSDDDDDASSTSKPPAVIEGGPRPDIEPLAPKSADYRSTEPVGTIVIDTAARKLYLIRTGSKAYVYPISVGREGFTWTGQEKISRVANWPDWHPPAEMRERNPRLPIKMTGGLNNPLGAKALYLGNSLYRIHGTSDAKSIGRAASSGCFRMHNRHVVDLAGRVGVGTRVVVIKATLSRTASAGR